MTNISYSSDTAGATRQQKQPQKDIRKNEGMDPTPAKIMLASGGLGNEPQGEIEYKNDEQSPQPKVFPTVAQTMNEVVSAVIAGEMSRGEAISRVENAQLTDSSYSSFDDLEELLTNLTDKNGRSIPTPLTLARLGEAREAEAALRKGEADPNISVDDLKQLKANYASAMGALSKQLSERIREDNKSPETREELVILKDMIRKEAVIAMRDAVQTEGSLSKKTQAKLNNSMWGLKLSALEKSVIKTKMPPSDE